jgi:hypothetical protein
MATQTEAEIQAVVAEWEQKFKPANLLQTEHNLSVMKEAVAATIRHYGAITVQNLIDLVRVLGDMKTGGRLQFGEVAPPPFDPVAATPHQDKFVGVNSISRCVKYAATYRIDDKDVTAFNELLAHCKKFDIRSTDTIFPTPANATSRKAADSTRDVQSGDGDAISGYYKGKKGHDPNRMDDRGDSSPIRGIVTSTRGNVTEVVRGASYANELSERDLSTPFGQAVNILNRLKVDDVGSFIPGKRFDKLQAFKRRVTMEISAQRAKKVPDEKILGKRSVSTSGRSVGGCGRWPDVGTYESVHLGNKWTLWNGQSLRESHRDDGGRWERSAGSSNRP